MAADSGKASCRHEVKNRQNILVFFASLFKLHLTTTPQMKPFAEFCNRDQSFWANTKLISETIGYSERNTERLKRYTIHDVVSAFTSRKITFDHVYNNGTMVPTELGKDILTYLNKRSKTIEEAVKPNLMDREEARVEFEKIHAQGQHNCYLPMNKQKGEKRHNMYMTGIVNMLTEEALGGVHFDDNPKGLMVITKAGRPFRTLSRWMDGAYPSLVDPIAVWETKEYYGTTTFGSRVADGVYETMLDGHELQELEQAGRKISHYLIVDDRFTWWTKGRSYLCRIIDILNMGLVDEVLFGREVLNRWQDIVKSWKK